VELDAPLQAVGREGRLWVLARMLGPARPWGSRRREVLKRASREEGEIWSRLLGRRLWGLWVGPVGWRIMQRL